MKKINPLKLTLITIPLAIVLTLLLRYLLTAVLGSPLHPAFVLIIYIVMFTALKIVGEKMANRGKFSWLLSRGD